MRRPERKNIQTEIQSIYNNNIDHILCTDPREQYVKRQPEKSITKYTNIKSALDLYDNLPTGLKTFSLLSTLQYYNDKK